MILNLHERKHSKNSHTSENYSLLNLNKKPVEIYYFIDPLCTKCWALEPYFKKFSIEFGRFFTIRPIISNHLNIVKPNPLEKFFKKKGQNARNSNSNSSYEKDQLKSAYPAIIMAIKAAELQGKIAGHHFLNKLREKIFLKNENILDLNVLQKCAYEAKLDIDEFKKDLHSKSAKKASQCDIKISKEMNVTKAPTLVFFNHLEEEDGIKVSGKNPYDIYVSILSDLLKFYPIPSKKPSIQDYLAKRKIVTAKEIAVIYDLDLAEVDRELMKLQLLQIASKREVDHNIFWEYTP